MAKRATAKPAKGRDYGAEIGDAAIRMALADHPLNLRITGRLHKRIGACTKWLGLSRTEFVRVIVSAECARVEAMIARDGWPSERDER